MSGATEGDRSADRLGDELPFAGVAHDAVLVLTAAVELEVRRHPAALQIDLEVGGSVERDADRAAGGLEHRRTGQPAGDLDGAALRDGRHRSVGTIDADRAADGA